MYESSGDGWSLSAKTNGQMLLALYLRDLAGIQHAGQPVLCPVAPAVKPVAAAEVPEHSSAELKQEWQQWWHRLLRSDAAIEAAISPPHFHSFDDSPSLQRLLRAHYGAAFVWARSRQTECDARTRDHAAAGRWSLLEEMLRERGASRASQDGVPLSLTLVELPLAEPRAWFLEPGTVLLSHDLPRHETLFRSYLEPMVELLP